MLNHYYRAPLAALILLLAAAPAAFAQSGVGIGTTAPDVSAALDIVSSSKGVLLPRVADATAIATPATGLLVFQTGGTPGFYYNAGTPGAPIWQQLATATGAPVTASNGLTKTGANIALGGTLTGATTIAQVDNNFSLAAGNVGIGTATPGAQLHVAGNMKIDGANTLEFGAGVSKEINAGKIGYRVFSSDALDIVGAGTTGTNRVIRFYAEGGAVFNGMVTGVGAFNTSDARFKTNVRPLGGALAAVLALRGVRYEWNALGQQHGGTAGAGQVGLIAQEIEKIYPELVATGTDGYKAVNYAQLAPVLIEAIKEQQTQMKY